MAMHRARARCAAVQAHSRRHLFISSLSLFKEGTLLASPPKSWHLHSTGSRSNSADEPQQMHLCLHPSPAVLSPMVQDVASRSTELEQQELTRGNPFLLTGVFWKHGMASGQKGLLLFWNKHRQFEVLAQQRWRGT